MTSKLQKRLVVAGVAVFGAYAISVISTGAGWNPAKLSWNFENSGQFGDSFGPLSALMSTVAAVSALLAYWSQRDELDRLKSSEANERERREKREFEETFFRLVSLFRDTLNAIEYDDGGAHLKRGSDALSAILHSEMKWHDDRGFNSLEDKFKRMYRHHNNKLGHYFRLYYHVLKFVDESAVSEKKTYTRVLRSTTSNIEMAAIGLNCCHGSGKPKLKRLVEKHAMLHNISSSDAQSMQITKLMAAKAFGDRTVLEDGSLE